MMLVGDKKLSPETNVLSPENELCHSSCRQLLKIKTNAFRTIMGTIQTILYIATILLKHLRRRQQALFEVYAINL